MRVIDVSNWQGRPDWSHVRAGGVTAAYIKATEGIGIVDPELDRNAHDARKAGVVVGFYHFAHPSNSPLAEARHFLRTVGPLGEGANLRPGDLVPVLDLETSEGHSFASLSEWKAAWLRLVDEAVGVRFGAMLYSDYYMLRNLQIAPSRRIWGASYGFLPAPARERWSLWQYSATGRVAGISGAVDLDHALRALPTIPVRQPTGGRI